MLIFRLEILVQLLALVWTRFENRTSKFDFTRVMALLWKIRVDPGGGHFIASFFRLLVFYLTVRASRHFFSVSFAKKLRSTRNAMTDLGSFSVGMHEILLFLCMTRSIIFVCCRIKGGPPLTRKSLTQFPLPRFLAYVHASGGLLRK